ncbi:MAG TPA: pirin family protein [Caulobacteraceae bacterium]|jgi:hypothetical protein
MKKVVERYGNDSGHWVGDGFPVRSMFSYEGRGQEVSPFLLLDYAGPYEFAPTGGRRGVGRHPLCGFETVTIVYKGEVELRDPSGGGGVIGPGDVQWMTAGAGIVHDEFHSEAFARRGGPMQMVQLWVNLPARNKMARPAYQSIRAADIPTVSLPGSAGEARIIAGRFGETAGPARTFTPVNVWDVRLNGGAQARLPLPQGHTAMVLVLSGQVTACGMGAGQAQMLLLDREGEDVILTADADASLLVLSGEPIDEPIVGYGPLVMNSEAEIRQALEDYRAGSFGALKAA